MPQTTTCPEAILAAIPWYPDGLSAEECGAVEAHAADCRACRAELAFLRGDEEPGVELPDAEAIYARVLERIGQPDENEGEAGAPPPRASFSQRAAQPVSVVAGLAVALLSGMLTTGVIWAARVAPTYEVDVEYEPVSAETAVLPADGAYLEITFRPDATVEEIATQLRSARASVIAGPSPRGVFRLRLAPGTDPAAALEQLRTAGVALHAEPDRG